jgi:hypothetical protein
MAEKDVAEEGEKAENPSSASALLLVTFPEVEEATSIPEIKDNLKSHLLSRGAASEVQIEGLDTDVPTCSIGAFNFVGSYEHMLGSQMFFDVDNDKDDKRNVQADGLGRKKLVFKLKNYVGEKRKADEASSDGKEEDEEEDEEEDD